jgi:hypothetical protein
VEPSGSSPGVPGFLVALLCLVGCAGESGRDVVGPSHDVVAPRTATRSADGYEYVAKRAFSVVALAEARGIEFDVARAAIDQVADALDVCTTEQRRKGEAPRGAARVVAQVGPGGTVDATTVRVDPGAGVPTAALLCLVVPTRRLAFPPVDAGVRGFALEALWGQAQ